MHGRDWVHRLLLVGSLLGCGGVSTHAGEDAGASTHGGEDAGMVLRACPTSGPGAVVSAGRCWVFSPASAGAGPGQNATSLSYAVEPSGAGSGTLVLLLNGSGGTPGLMVRDPSLNLFTAATESGHHVLAIAYRSDLAVAEMCGPRPDCYGATRRTQLTGVFEAEADASLMDIRVDEGVIPRLDQALRALAAWRPDAGWSAFIGNPGASAAADRIDWQRVIASGHSQGGGHAAYLGKLFPLRRVVQFSSTCDAPGGVPAPWTAAASGWATSPGEAFFGLSAPTVFRAGVPTGGDLNCPYHLAVWQNLGMAESRQADDAATCAGVGPHGASIGCTANYSRWVELFR